MDMTKKEARPENYKWVYNLGVVGLAAMAMVWFWLAIQISCMSPEARGFSGIYSIVIAFLGGPCWLAIGCLCLAYAKKVPVDYRVDVTMIGALNILGIVFTVGFPIFYKLTLVVWLIYFGAIFGWIIYRSSVRKSMKDA